MFFVTLFLSIFATNFFFVNGQSVSNTTNSGNSSGICKSLYECETVLNVFKKPDKTQADIDFLRNSKCGYEGKIPKVNCPEPCYTPEGAKGMCVNIYSCPHIVGLLTSPTAKKNVQYVANSRCGKKGEMSVCCGPATISAGKCASLVDFTTPPDADTECCGLHSSGNKIAAVPVDGEATVIDQHPWLALIEHIKGGDVQLVCGGSLISGRHVLTAAHCVAGQVLDIGTPKNVRLGEYNTKHDGQDCVTVDGGGEDCTEGVILIPIESTIPHPDYNTNIKHSSNDIALVKLQQTAPYTDFIRPICLPMMDLTLTPPKYFSLSVAGWGAASVSQPSSDVKIEVFLSFVEKNKCEQGYKPDGRDFSLAADQICVGGVPGKDSCKSDSGGPLMFKNGRTWEVIGVSSFDPSPCGLPNVPGVYTKVHKYNDWIRSVIIQ